MREKNEQESVYPRKGLSVRDRKGNNNKTGILVSFPKHPLNTTIKIETMFFVCEKCTKKYILEILLFDLIKLCL